MSAARHLAETLPTPIVVVGEPSRNTLRRGHRGRTELVVHFKGRSVHASVPEKGVNPLYALGLFLGGFERSWRCQTDADLGPSTVAPTLLATDQTSANVVPGEVWQTCDWRNIPGQSGEDAQRSLAASRQERFDGSPGRLKASRSSVSSPVVDRCTYTGLDRAIPGAHPAISIGLPIIRRW